MPKKERQEGPIEGWHFIDESLRLSYNDNRKAQHEKWLEARMRSMWIDGSKQERPSLCHQGMHASKGIMYALRFARNRPILCRVEVRDDIQERQDKFVGRERKVLWWVDARPLFREFIRLMGDQKRKRDWYDVRQTVQGLFYDAQGEKKKRMHDLLRRLAWKHARKQWEFEATQ